MKITIPIFVWKEKTQPQNDNDTNDNKNKPELMDFWFVKKLWCYTGARVKQKSGFMKRVVTSGKHPAQEIDRETLHTSPLMSYIA